MHRNHGALQNALSSTTYLTRISDSCRSVGLNVDATALFESAQVLWDQGEMTASIRMLKDMRTMQKSSEEISQVSKASLLARLVSPDFLSLYALKYVAN